ncbi:MAG: hypothetical protein AAB472_01350 [Patescibacteria group bacterium]
MDEMNNDQVMGDEQETAAAMPAEEAMETEAAPEVAEETGEEAA